MCSHYFAIISLWRYGVAPHLNKLDFPFLKNGFVPEKLIWAFGSGELKIHDSTEKCKQAIFKLIEIEWDVI